MFEHIVRVRWRDTGALGHVNHAVFLTYLEEGRDAFYVQALGSDPHYVVARIELDLRTEVRHPDQQVTVRIQAERLGTTSLTTRETILAPSGEVAAEARVVTVRWDPGRRQPIPFSDTERMRPAATSASSSRRVGFDNGVLPLATTRSHFLKKLLPRTTRTLGGLRAAA